MSGTLWLVRHGHTVLHGTDGIAGRRNVALGERGREAVAALGRTLAASSIATRGAPRWYASPAARTRETAALLRAAVGHGDRPLDVDGRLVELDFGDWEGSTWAAVHRNDGPALAAWGEDWVDGAPPNGESFRVQAARCGAWFDEALGGGTREAREAGGASDAPRDDVVVVTHGGCVRALACRLLGWPLADALRLAVDPASVYRFERDARRPSGWRLAGANLPDFGDGG